LDRAVLQTVAYGDLFDYPLTAAEIWRYLIGLPASESEVRRALSNGGVTKQRLVQRDGFIALRGRSEIIEIRQRRMARAERLWPAALHYGRLVGALPFVRMVAVTGSLAVDNADSDSDIDYFIVTESGRLWLCRAMVILIVRLAARRAVAICPNYFLTERALSLTDRNLYAARELAQMIPLNGMEVYWRIRSENAWVAQYLPNAGDAPVTPSYGTSRPLPAPVSLLRGAMETLLRTPPGRWLEQWEMDRKVRRFSRESGDESVFSADWCKGHFDHHGRRALEEYSKRWQELSQEPEGKP
jgi:hypothetical protein